MQETIQLETPKECGQTRCCHICHEVSEHCKYCETKKMNMSALIVPKDLKAREEDNLVGDLLWLLDRISDGNKFLSPEEIKKISTGAISKWEPKPVINSDLKKQCPDCDTEPCRKCVGFVKMETEEITAIKSGLYKNEDYVSADSCDSRELCKC